MTKAGPGRAAPPRKPGVVPAVQHGAQPTFIKAEEGSSRAGVKGLTFQRQDKQDRQFGIMFGISQAVRPGRKRSGFRRSRGRWSVRPVRPCPRVRRGGRRKASIRINLRALGGRVASPSAGAPQAQLGPEARRAPGRSPSVTQERRPHPVPGRQGRATRPRRPTRHARAVGASEDGTARPRAKGRRGPLHSTAAHYHSMALPSEIYELIERDL